MIKISFERGGHTQELSCDGYVLVAWNLKEDGTKVFPPLINASTPPDVSGTDMVYAVGSLALAMEGSEDKSVQLVGKLMRTSLEKGLTLLEAATESGVES